LSVDQQTQAQIGNAQTRYDCRLARAILRYQTAGLSGSDDEILLFSETGCGVHSSEIHPFVTVL
jgi:hypothetical protein